MQPDPRILVVDDDRIMLTLLISILKHEGFHHVDKASSGEEALEKCAESPPDIIFMDIEMPGMNGIEAMEAVHQRNVATQVILVSANPKTQYVMSAKEHKAAGFVVKPMSPKVVSDAIAKCLKNTHPGSVGTQA